MQLDGVVAIPEDVQQRYVDEGLWDDVVLRDGIEAWAARTPDRIALVDAGLSLSYAQLEASVASAVAVLRGRDLGPGTAVVVVAPLAAEGVIAYHALLRTGALVVMLDRRCGKADAAHAAEVPGVALVVTPEDLVEPLDLGALGVPVLTYPELLVVGEPDRGWSEPSPRAAAAVVFTSGTTSRPKGVVHSLNTLRSGARSMADAFELSEADVAFLSTPLASITGLVQTHLMLDRGGALVLEDRFSPPASLQRLRTHGATVLGGAPVIVEELFKQAASEGLETLPLRAMALGGTMIPKPVLELAIQRFGIAPVRMYGASEIPSATGTRPSDEGVARIGDDGAPARGTELRNDGEVPGEILVRGPMRFLGYLDPDDNRGVFAAEGWLRTGDLGDLTDGRLTVTGRLKEVIARKGLKISLAEVDEAARALPGVAEAAAYGIPDEETGERLVLAVHLDRPGVLAVDEVMPALLAGGLAKYKLPEQVVLWEGPLPRTESGKIQRRLIADDLTPRPTWRAARLQLDRVNP